MENTKTWLWFLVPFCLAAVGCADSNKNRSFITIENPIPCIRRFNATHQIGCAKADIDSYKGIVLAVRDESEMARLNTTDFGASKVIAVTVPRFFANVVDSYLAKRAESPINGIVLVVGGEGKEAGPVSFSDDAVRPNEKFALYDHTDVDWNAEQTNNYMFQQFDIPVYVITEETEASKIFNDCYEEFNRKVFEEQEGNTLVISASGYVCGMDLGMDMSGAVSSEVCIRRANIQYTVDANLFCDPLGGMNYFTFLSQRPANNLPITILSSRIDTFTMYEYYTPAANEPISSIISLLVLAELFAKHRTDITNSNVMFTLFDNEAFEYGGSSRFVNDLVLDKFPTFTINDANSTDGTSSFKLDKSNLKTIIELNQLGSIGLEENANLYVHKDPVSYSKNESIRSTIDEYIAKLTNYSENLVKPVSNTNQQLPPSSVHSFLRLDLDIAGILITDHETEYKNKFFHSVFDTPEKINATFPSNMTESEAASYNTGLSIRLQKYLTSIAKSVYFMTTNKDLSDQINQTSLNKLIYCFYKNTTCEYFKNMFTDAEWKYYTNLLEGNLPKNRLSFYTSVRNGQISGKWLAQMLLKYFTRNTLFEQLSSSDCSKDSDAFRKVCKDNNLSITNVKFANGVCIASALYAESSVSPAFDEYEKGKLVNTDKFPAWTESSWNGKPVQMRLFMFTNQVVEVSALVLGIITLIVSFAATLVANRLSDKWFKIDQPEHIAEIIEQ